MRLSPLTGREGLSHSCRRPFAAPSCLAPLRKIPPASAPSGDAQPRGAFVACRVTDSPAALTAGHLTHPTGGLPHGGGNRSTVIPRDSPGQAHAGPAVRGRVPRLHRRVDRQPGASLYPARPALLGGR